MPGIFPRPGDDELLYSVIARYGAMAGNGVGGQLIQEFFDTSVGIAAVDLPCRIDMFASRIPRGTAWGRDRLIDGHTLFPYQLRFAPPAVAAAVRGYMAGGEGRRPARLGVMSAAFPTSERLMLCPACAREDAAGSGFGIANWRRVHQLPGVLVCPRHGRPLYESEVARIDRRGKGALIPLTRAVRDASRPLALPRGTTGKLLTFAVASERLLSGGTNPCDTAALQARLKGLLPGYRWSRAPSLLHIEALVGDFLRHPGIRSLMSAIDLAWTDGQVATALNRLLYRETAAKHPLMVLMVLELAGATMDDLAGADAVPPPARPTPGRVKATIRHDLSCGNPACGRFAGEIVGADAGTSPVRAECTACGYVYALDSRRPGGTCTLETGALWDGLLVRTLSGGDIGVRAAGRALGVAPTTVMRHARRLGLWQEEWKDRPKLRLRRETLAQRLLERHRAGWLAFRAAGVAVPTKTMPREAFNAYRYLIRKDRGWLRTNSP